MNNVKEKLVFALDVPDLKSAKALIKELAEYVGVFKVGKELFTAVGPEIFKVIKENNGKIFADLKYHDIPNTVASAARVLVRHGVEIFNVHATGGFEMINMTAKAIKEEAEKLGINRPKLLAVTVLTSLNDEDLKSLKINETTSDYVIDLAKLAKSAGADGVVCSPNEVEQIKKELGKEFITLTPGIRPLWSVKGDQKRVMTPAQAVKNGVDYIVVGRPIRNVENRVEAAKKILKEMSE
ncbi:orotidine-5'-phosphate decarboxylase [Haliovirga abyssi]|uniref:Orotidine 5'-phosphate decarboxylase n=1 Tax=Haliovirga abyssi TaxID=2996794 RepID=A0AAU9DLP0_9FUSO|nr:orotidine-5'-phosphate decarboxylase [Haliovirga abyssi]BDU50877.1 orotidine 5'-phosphate decarboxylase [Haliovirga abyssi]